MSGSRSGKYDGHTMDLWPPKKARVNLQFLTLLASLQLHQFSSLLPSSCGIVIMVYTIWYQHNHIESYAAAAISRDFAFLFRENILYYPLNSKGTSVRGDLHPDLSPLVYMKVVQEGSEGQTDGVRWRNGQKRMLQRVLRGVGEGYASYEVT